MYGTIKGHSNGIAQANKKVPMSMAMQRVCARTIAVWRRRWSGMLRGAKRMREACQFLPASRPEVRVRFGGEGGGEAARGGGLIETRCSWEWEGEG